MAQNTESSGTHLMPYRSPYGMFPIRGYQQTTNSTFVAGHLVELNTGTNAHRLRTASSNSTRLIGVAAESGASNATAGVGDGQRMMPVYEARPEIEFMGWLKGEVIASTLVGQRRAFARDSTANIDYLTSSQTTSAFRVQITEVGADSNVSAQGRLASIGDTNGYVAFRFLPQFTQFAEPTFNMYTVEYTPPAIAANSADETALSSHADFSTDAIYIFSPVTAIPSSRYVMGPCYCSTATQLRLRIANPGASTIGTGESTQRGIVMMFQRRR